MRPSPDLAAREPDPDGTDPDCADRRRAPIATAPIATADTSVNTTTDNPAPELLDDGPLASGAVSRQSITRSDGVEVVSFRQAGNTGFDEIAVAGYNGAFSTDPFELRVAEQDPPPLPASARTARSRPGTRGRCRWASIRARRTSRSSTSGGCAGCTRARRRDRCADLQTRLLDREPRRRHPDRRRPRRRNAASAWDQNLCSPDAANDYVHAINTLVASYRANLTNLQSITIVGDDEQIPFARVADFVPVNSESTTRTALSLPYAGQHKDNATYAASALGYVLTDDAYGAFHTRTLFGHEFFLPEVAMGRLVETPGEIDGQLAAVHPQHVARPRRDIAASSPATTSCRTTRRRSTTASCRGSARPSPATNTLLRDTWGKSALEGLLKGTTPSAKVNSWNAHYDYRRVSPPCTPVSDLLSTDIVPADVSQQFAGNIFFTMGCHAGESIADTLLPASG